MGELPDRQANGFLGTSHQNLPFAKGRGTPALSGNQFFLSKFFVVIGCGFDHAQFTLIRKSEQVLARKDDISWAVSVLTPFYTACLELDALEWAVPVFFEAEHAIEVTVMVDGSAPMIDHIIGLTPNLTAGKFTSLFADLVETGTHPVSS